MTVPRGTDPKRELTPQQRRFVEAVVEQDSAEGPDVERAALTAGYSARTAYAQGRRLYLDPRVQRELLRFREGVSELAKLDAAWLLDQLRSIWEADLADLFDDDGRLRPIPEMPLELQRLIGGFELTQTTDECGTTTCVAKLKFASRFAILDRIGRHVDVSAFGKRESEDPGRGLADLMRAMAAAGRVAEARRREPNVLRGQRSDATEGTWTASDDARSTREP